MQLCNDMDTLMALKMFDVEIEDNRDFLETPIKWLHVVGVLTKKRNFCSDLIIILTFGFVSIPVLSFWSYSYKYSRVNGFEFQQHSANLGGSFVVGFGALFIVIVYCYSERVQIVVDQINRDIKTSKDLKKVAVILEIILKSCMFYIFMPISIITTFVIIIHSFSCPEFAKTSCVFGYESDFPFNFYYTPMRQIITTFVHLNISYNILMVITATGVLLFAFEMIIFRFIRLQKKVELISEHQGISRKKFLGEIVLEHQELIRLSDHLVIILKYPLLIVMALGAGVLTLSAYCIIKDFKLFHLLTLLCTVSFITACAIQGERLREVSSELGSAVFYSIPWDGDIRTQKDMLFIMTRCSRPITLKIGDFTTLDYPAVLWVLKSTYSFIAILLNKEK